VQITYTSGEQIEVYRFSIPVTIGVPLLALFLQAFIPLRFPNFAVYVDLPLLVTIFFAMARRNPISGLLTGSVIGLAQDMLGHGAIGIYGHAWVLSDPFRRLFHGSARHGQYDADLELAARNSGWAGERGIGHGAVFLAGQV
jgi:hypothetical protein